MTSISDRTTGRGNGVAPGQPLGRDKAMTLHEMAESVHKMLALAVAQGIDAKDVQVASIQFTTCGNDSADIYNTKDGMVADIYFIKL